MAVSLGSLPLPICKPLSVLTGAGEDIHMFKKSIIQGRQEIKFQKQPKWEGLGGEVTTLSQSSLKTQIA